MQNIVEIKSQIRGGSKIMSLDVGSKKIGVALSSADLQIAFPKSVIIRRNFNSALESIRGFVLDNDVSVMIVGLPLKMDGEESGECVNIRHFINKVLKFIDLPVYYQDERFSTKIANQFLCKSGVSAKKSAEIDDQIAASLILESFLQKISAS